jgi:hypothetical protein
MNEDDNMEMAQGLLLAQRIIDTLGPDPVPRTRPDPPARSPPRPVELDASVLSLSPVSGAVRMLDYGREQINVLRDQLNQKNEQNDILRDQLKQNDERIHRMETEIRLLQDRFENLLPSQAEVELDENRGVIPSPVPRVAMEERLPLRSIELANLPNQSVQRQKSAAKKSVCADGVDSLEPGHSESAVYVATVDPALLSAVAVSNLASGQQQRRDGCQAIAPSEDSSDSPVQAASTNAANSPTHIVARQVPPTPQTYKEPESAAALDEAALYDTAAAAPLKERTAAFIDLSFSPLSAASFTVEDASDDGQRAVVQEHLPSSNFENESAPLPTSTAGLNVSDSPKSLSVSQNTT